MIINLTSIKTVLTVLKFMLLFNFGIKSNSDNQSNLLIDSISIIKVLPVENLSRMCENV